MKFATLTVLPLLASAAVVPAEHRTTLVEDVIAQPNPIQLHSLEKRQFWNSVGSLLQFTLPTLLRWWADNMSWMLSWQEAPVKKTLLQPEMFPQATRAIFRYGPWVLTGTDEIPAWKPDYQMDPKSTTILRTLKGLPSNAAILKARQRLVFENGTKAGYSEGFYVHHFLIADMSKPSAPFALCPNMHKETDFGLWAAGYVLEAVGAGLVQVGQDAVDGPNVFAATRGNLKSAYLTNNNDLFALQSEIVNYNPTNRTVYLELDLEYLEQKPSDYLDASTIVVSATGCAAPIYMVPKTERQFNHTSEPFEITQDGYIVNTRGHLHDGGIAIELWVNNVLACRSLPTYGRPEHAGPDFPETIIDMETCETPFRIHKKDLLRVVTYYDIDKHPQRKGAGHMHGHGGGNDTKTNNMGDGLEEMGIMTTNFAWDAPVEVKPDSSGGAYWASWGTPPNKTAPNPNYPTVKGNVNAEKTATDAANKESSSWWSSIFGSSNQTVKIESPKSVTVASPLVLPPRPSHSHPPAAPAAAAAATPSSGSWWSNLWGSSSTPSPAASATAAAPAAPESTGSWWSSLWGSSSSPSSSPSPTVAKLAVRTPAAWQTPRPVSKPGQPGLVKPNIPAISAVAPAPKTDGNWLSGLLGDRSSTTGNRPSFGPGSQEVEQDREEQDYRSGSSSGSSSFGSNNFGGGGSNGGVYMLPRPDPYMPVMQPQPDPYMPAVQPRPDPYMPAVVSAPSPSPTSAIQGVLSWLGSVLGLGGQPAAAPQPQQQPVAAPYVDERGWTWER